MRRLLLTLGMMLSANTMPPDIRAKEVWFAFPADAVFETGDTWVANGLRYRLYGVQSCLRGTVFTNLQNQRVDCGEAGIAMLAAMVRDLKPRCAVSARIADLAHVVCVANVSVLGQTTRLDLGTALITAGYAFAAVNTDGRPLHEPYGVAQAAARQAQRGFHAFADLPDPNRILLRTPKSPDPAAPVAPSPPQPPAPVPSRQ